MEKEMKYHLKRTKEVQVVLPFLWYLQGSG